MSSQVDHPERETVPGSPISRLREVRQEVAQRTTVDLDVPGYQGLLIARYEPIPYDVETRATRRALQHEGDPDAITQAAADCLISACVGMYYRDEQGEVQPLMWEQEQVRFDKGLAAVLDLEFGETPREVLLGVFHTGAQAVEAQFDALRYWSITRDREIDDQLVERAGQDETLAPLSLSSHGPESSG